MHDWAVVIGLIVWIVGSIMKTLNSSKKPTRVTPGQPQTGSPAAPRGRTNTTTGGTRPAPTQGQLIRQRDSGRAMSTASPRLAEGAEYGPIVADRLKDSLTEQRFAKQTQALISSEPKERPSAGMPSSSVYQANTFLNKLQSNPDTLLNAVILSQVLGPPNSRFKRS